MKLINSVVFRVLIAGLLTTSMVGFGTTSASAAVVYDQRPASYISGNPSTPNNLVATSVSLPNSITFNRAIWAVEYTIGALQVFGPLVSQMEFDMVVYADSNGFPGVELAREAMVVDGTSAPIIQTVGTTNYYEFQSQTANDITLAAGNYWMSVFQTDTSDPQAPWAFDFDPASQTSVSFKSHTAPWQTPLAGLIQDLQLQNVSSNAQTIPSPAGLGAVALAALTLLVPHRKRKSR